MKNSNNSNNIKKTFTKQYSQFYCGLACLASIVKYHGGNISQEILCKMSGTTIQGTSLLGLYQTAQKLGFDVKGYKADIEVLKKIDKPVILHTLQNEGFEHFVVCYESKNGLFVIGDPSQGIIKYSTKELEAIWKSKAVLVLKPGNKFKKKKDEAKSKAKWFIDLIREDLPILLIAAFLGTVMSILGLAVPIYIQRLVDHVLPIGNEKLVYRSLGIFTMIILAKAFIGYVRGIFLVNQGKDMNIRVVSLFFGKLMYLPMSFYNSTSTGDMIARLNDSQRIQRTVINLSSNVIIDILIIISSLVYIFTLSSSTGIICLFVLPVFCLLAVRYNHKIIDSEREVMKAYAATEEKYIDTIQGINVIKSSNRESLFIKLAHSSYSFFQKKICELGVLGNKINLWAQVISGIFFSGIIAWTAFLFLWNQLSLGQMIAIITIVSGLVTSVINTVMSNIQFQEANVAFERMYEFMVTEPEYCESESTLERFIIDEISIKSLNFRFQGRSLLLKEVNINVHRGKIISIFGEIGCGKSTLLSIIQRFYPIESGKIIINQNIDWNFISNKEWRNLTAYVPQDIKLFNTTVLANICLDEDPDVEKVVNFCCEIGIDKFIKEFEQGYATIINENGNNLSGGQQQLVSLARALYQRPQILLLDEATVAMDKRIEQFVFSLLQRLKKDLIIFFVTHRIHLAKQTDIICVIENKIVTAIGTHEEVLKKNDLYRYAFEEVILQM